MLSIITLIWLIKADSTHGPRPGLSAGLQWRRPQWPFSAGPGQQHGSSGRGRAALPGLVAGCLPLGLAALPPCRCRLQEKGAAESQRTNWERGTGVPFRKGPGTVRRGRSELSLQGAPFPRRLCGRAWAPPGRALEGAGAPAACDLVTLGLLRSYHRDSTVLY